MKKALLAVAALLFPLGALAQSCHGRWVNPMTDVCWSCMFPMSLGGASLFSSELPDPDNLNIPLCHCGAAVGEHVGLSVGFWEPIRLVDVTRTPMCMVGMGGLNLAGQGAEKIMPRGAVDLNTEDSTQQSVYQVHWYAYPLLYWLNLITDAGCVEQRDFSLMWLSELDVAWQDDEWSLALNPESLLFANLPAQASCMADALAASTIKKPIDALFWCAGAQGSFYPLTGHVSAHTSGVESSLLLAERANYRLHRLGLMADSSASSMKAQCKPRYRPILPKSRYRMQMTYPVADAGKHGCHPLGATSAVWGAGHEFPVKGEDFGYLVWRKRNCCAGLGGVYE